MKKYVFIGIVVILFCILVGVRVVQQRQITHQISSDTSLRVVASFYPLAEFAQRIGGNLVSVTNLTPAGSEPHDFDPSAKDVALLHDSNIFIYNGAGLEAWADRVIPDLHQSNSTIVRVTDGMQLLTKDPHVWLSPKRVQQEVRAIERGFEQADSVHAATYAANADAYIAQLQQLDTDFISGTAKCARHDIVTSHAAFAYLAKDYGLIMTPIAGLSPDAEPSPARLAEISDFVRTHGVTHIFFETLVSPAISETIAHETGAQTIAFNPLEGLTQQEISEGKNYISVQHDNLTALRTALNCL